MFQANVIVVHRDVSRFLSSCSCGIVEGGVEEEPGFVWVRWIGEVEKKKENAQDLIEV